MSLTYGSVCSGIEAASAGWLPLGYKCAFVSEIEPFPCAVLKHHHPETPNLGDMTKHNEWPIFGIDVLVGGTPCQSFSVAGLRRGLADPRGNLTLVFLGIVARQRPRWLVWENVPGVLSDKTGAFGAFLGGLGKLGYGFAYRVLDAQYCGVAQRRRRVFVVGHSGGLWQRAAAVLFERSSLRGDPPPSREARKGVAVSVIKGAAIGRQPSAGPQFGEHLDDGTCYTLNCTETHAVAQPIPFDVRQITSKTNRSRADAGDPSPTLNDSAGMHVALPLGINGTDLSYALRAEASHSGDKGDGGVNTTMVATKMAVRRLTPRECERLQGFPDNHTRIPWRGKPADQCPDGPRYKALGNSMAVPVMRWISQRINQVEKITP